MISNSEIVNFLDFLGEPILLSNVKSEIVFANSACLKLFGYTKDQMLKLRLDDLAVRSELLNKTEKFNHKELVENYISLSKPAKEMTERMLIKCIHADGKQFDTRISIASAKIGNERYGVEILQDYTSIQNVISELESDSNIDVLTSLYNRRYLHSIMKESSRLNTAWSSIGVMYLDLNKFKPINDNLGHGAGDEILKVVASRIKDSVRFDDIILRIGGDEFMVLINLSEVEKKTQLLDKISNEISILVSSPIPVEKRTVNVGVSIGVGIYPDDCDDLADLMSFTDKAMYLSKANGHAVSFVNQLPNIS